MGSGTRSFSLLAAFSVLVAAAVMLAVLIDTAVSEANNPPTSLLGLVSVDPNEPPPDLDILTDDKSPVWAIVEGNGRYYVGGNFSEIGGVQQPALAAVEVATGQLDSAFAPAVTGSGQEIMALALSPDGSDLYIAGKFTQVDGSFRNRVAKLDALTGVLDPTFNPDVDAVVETIITDGISVWIGGKFDNVGGQPAAKLAKVDASTGALDPAWVGFADGTVLDVELSSTGLWVGGNFSTIAGQSFEKLARLDPATGTVSPLWAPDFPEDEKVLALSPSPDGNTIYVGTAGTPSDGGNAVRAYSASGTALWQQINAGDIQAIEATADTVYAGTHGNWVFLIAKFNLDGTENNDVPGEDSNLDDDPFPTNGYVEDPTNTNAVRRNKLFSLDADTGDLLAWDPNGDTTDGVWELESGPSGLLTGGDFRNIFNPTGTPGEEPGVFTPHLAVFAGLGNGGNAAPEPLFTIDCAGTACNVDGSASLDDGTVTAWAWDFGDGQTASGVAASAVLANNTTHNITLTVTDDQGLSASRTRKAIVGTGGLPIAPIATTSLNQTSNLFVQQLPATAQADDLAIAFLSVNDPAVTATAPAGWVFVGDQTAQNTRTFIWSRALNAAEPGTNAPFNLSTSTKADLTISTFRGVDGTTPVTAVAATAEDKTRVAHRAPALSFTGEATVLHYWADRSGANTEFAAPGTDANLATSIGSGNAHISAVLSVSIPANTDGSPQAVAVAEHPGQSAIGWSIAMRAGPPATDTTPPVVTFTTSTTQTPGVINLDGGVTDDLSGVNRVRVHIRDQQTGNYWNGTSWVAAWSWNLATLNGNDTWTLPNVDLSTPGDYKALIWAWDNQNNRANYTNNPQPTIAVN